MIILFIFKNVHLQFAYFSRFLCIYIYFHAIDALIMGFCPWFDFEILAGAEFPGSIPAWIDLFNEIEKNQKMHAQIVLACLELY